MPRLGQARPALVVATGTALSNVLAYGLSVMLSRQLGPGGFGEAAPLLAIVIVGTVPGQALQAGVARRTAQSAAARAPRSVLARAGLLGLGVAAVVLLAAPLLHALLELESWWSVVWTAASLAPTTICYAAFGVLQGGERFRRLAAALVVMQGMRLLGGAAGTLAGGSVDAALAGTAAGLLAGGAACALLAAPATVRSDTGASLLSGLARDTASILGIVGLTNLDVLLARAVLPPSEAGLYAAGAIIAKVAFFAPSFVVVVLYPRLSRAAERPAALRRAAVALAAWAVVATVGAAVCAPLVPLVLGEAYAPLAPHAWLFAAAGSALAAVFLLVQAGLAVDDHRLPAAVWVGAVVEAAVALSVVRSLVGLVTLVVAIAITLVVVGVVVERTRRRLGPPEPELALPGATTV